MAAGRVSLFVAVGIAIGLALSWLVGRGMLALIGGQTGVSSQIGALFATTLALVGAAGIAALVPARRATKIDPIVIMRE